MKIEIYSEAELELINLALITYALECRKTAKHLEAEEDPTASTYYGFAAVADHIRDRIRHG